MSPGRTSEDEAIAGRGVAPPGEAAPRQLAALLRIEDLLIEQNALLRELVAPATATGASAASPAPAPKPKSAKGA